MIDTSQVASEGLPHDTDDERRQILRHDLKGSLVNLKAFYKLFIDGLEESSYGDGSAAVVVNEDTMACAQLLGKAIDQTEQVMDEVSLYLQDSSDES